MNLEVPRVVRQLIDVVSKGEEVDWVNLQRQHATHEVDIGRIRAIDEIFGHRKTRENGEAAAQRSRYGVGLLVRILSALALAQIFFAFTGFLIGRGTPRAGWFPFVAVVVLSGCAIWLLVGGRHDRRATLLAAFFLAFASAASFPFVSLLLSGIPITLRFFVRAAGFLPECSIALFLWLFVREFPRLVHFGPFERLLSFGLALSACGGAALAAANIAALFSRPGVPESAPLVGILARSHPAGIYWLYPLTLCSLAIVVSWLRSKSARPMERRRLRTFLVGLAFGVGPFCVDVLLQYLAPWYLRFMSRPENVRWSTAMLYAVLLTTPLSTTYAVVADRLFDVRVVVRRALERKFADGALASMGVIPFVVLGLVLYEKRQESVAKALAESSAESLLAIGAVGLVLASLRRPLLGRVRRWAIPRSARPEEVIAETTQQMLAARSPQELQQAIATSASQAFGAHAEVLVAEEGSGRLSPLGRCRSLPATSSLIALAQSDPAPQRVWSEDDKSLFKWLPEEDKHWVLDATAASVVPAFGPGKNLLGFVTFGPRSDESPYTKADERLQAAIAGSLALALDTHRTRYGSTRPTAGLSDTPALICPECGTVCASTAPSVCDCSVDLKSAEIPFLVRGKLRLIRLLGRGGMSVVYEAEDEDLSRRVALKVIPQLSAVVSAQLRGEARAMASIEDANLARVYGLETWRGVAILILELLKGGTLAARLERPWPIREALKLGIQIADALNVVHRSGIVHRDVKPSNIGFATDGTPKLLDFGIARMMDEVTYLEGHSDNVFQSTVAGTPGYLSPEALHGRSGPDQDLWALSMVLYEMLAGSHPLAGVKPESMIRWTVRIPDLREFRDPCPEEVNRFFRRAFSVDPALRPQSAKLLSRELRELLERIA